MKQLPAYVVSILGRYLDFSIINVARQLESYILKHAESMDVICADFGLKFVKTFLEVFVLFIFTCLIEIDSNDSDLKL